MVYLNVSDFNEISDSRTTIIYAFKMWNYACEIEKKCAGIVVPREISVWPTMLQSTLRTLLRRSTVFMVKTRELQCRCATGHKYVHAPRPHRVAHIKQKKVQTTTWFLMALLLFPINFQGTIVKEEQPNLKWKLGFLVGFPFSHWWCTLKAIRT
jgi:hypothetical protein